MAIINFKDVEIDELFLFSGRRFIKKDQKTAYLLPDRQIKTFYEYMPVEPEEENKQTTHD